MSTNDIRCFEWGYAFRILINRNVGSGKGKFDLYIKLFQAT